MHMPDGESNEGDQRTEPQEQSVIPESVPIPKDISEILGLWTIQQTRPGINIIRQSLSELQGLVDESSGEFITDINDSLTSIEKLSLSFLRSEDPRVIQIGIGRTWYKKSHEVDIEPGSINDVDLHGEKATRQRSTQKLEREFSTVVKDMYMHEVANRINPASGFSELFLMIFKEEKQVGLAQSIHSQMQSVLTNLSPLLGTEMGEINIEVDPMLENPINITRENSESMIQ